MAPTPYAPTGRLELLLSVASQFHKIQLPVDYTFSGGAHKIVTRLGIEPAEDPAVVSQAVWDLIKGEYPSSVSAPNFTLYERDENIFIPRTGGACTSTGSGSGSIQQGTQVTLTFRDINQHLYRLQLPETLELSPQKVQYASVAGNLGTLMASLVDNATAGALGTWILSRAENFLDRPLWANVSENFKYKRARGI